MDCAKAGMKGMKNNKMSRIFFIRMLVKIQARIENKEDYKQLLSNLTR
jgi:hypothetical protein